MSSPLGRTRRAVFDRLPAREGRFVAEALREETVGGALLLVAAVVAVLWANLAATSYGDVQDTTVGPAALHLDLSLEAWAADGLLALFFFVAGLELKRELVVGQLSRPSAALLPVVAAVAGMAVPALCYLAVAGGDAGARHGWAVPMATDIAFALAVLAVAGSRLPTALRAFLLTLAVVDDLGAILVIAVAYTSSLDLLALAGAAVLLAGYAVTQRLRWHSGWLLLPVGVATWVLVHESGVHATVAGVALGLLTRVRPDPGESVTPAEHFEHRLRPLSAGLAVPAFALLSAGVPLSADALRSTASDVAAVGVVVGLVLGKFVGVLGATWLTVRLTRAELARGLAWADVAAVALLAGIGFTVSLLIADLAFAAEDPERDEHVKAAVLIGSLISALLASVLLRVRARAHQHPDDETEQREEADERAGPHETDAARRADDAPREGQGAD